MRNSHTALQGILHQTFRRAFGLILGLCLASSCMPSIAASDFSPEDVYEIFTADINGDGRPDYLIESLGGYTNIQLGGISLPVPFDTEVRYLVESVKGDAYRVEASPAKDVYSSANWINVSGDYAIAKLLDGASAKSSLLIDSKKRSGLKALIRYSKNDSRPSLSYIYVGSTRYNSVQVDPQSIVGNGPQFTSSLRDVSRDSPKSNLPTRAATISKLKTITEVGTLPGTFTVTPNGSATYTMPLELPPGPAGMSPKLSISYSSSGSDTFLGPGFSIGGFSQISRCSQNYADDGSAFIGGISLSSNDRFCLDGQRLVPQSGSSYGAVGITYRTQLDSFAQVKSLGGSAGAPSYWVVQTKSGLTMTFGQTYKFTVKGNSSKTLVWLLESSVDSAGNSILYTYTLPTSGNNWDGAYFPNTISYGGNSAQGTPNDIVVKFNYQAPAQFSPQGYLHGQIIHWSQLLDNISVSNSDDASGVYPTWIFGYSSPPNSTAGTPNAREVLSAVQKCFGTACSAPTLFDFANSVTTQYNPSYKSLSSGYSGGAMSKFPGDFDGDGIIDLIGLAVSNGTAHGFVWAGGQPNSAPLTWSTSGIPTTTATSVVISGQAAVADFNADGNADIAYVSVSVPSGKVTSNGSISITSWSGASSTQSPKSTQSSPGNLSAQLLACYQTGGGLSQSPPQTGDFNGDGLVDILLIYRCGPSLPSKTAQPSTYGQVLINNGNGTFSAAPEVLLANDTSFPGAIYRSSILVSDVDGDGHTDVLAIDPYYGGLTLFKGPALSSKSAVSLGLNVLNCGFTMADLNGDGAMDLLVTKNYPAGSPAQVATFINDGTGTFLLSGNGGFQSATLPTSDPYSPVVGDVNGDGLEDVVWVSSGNVATHYALPMLSLGNGTLQAAASASAFPLLSNEPITVFGADATGKGVSNLAAWGTPGSLYQNVDIGLYSFAAIPRARVSTITDGLGATVGIQYKALTDNIVQGPANVYSRPAAGSQVFPVLPFAAAMNVVLQTSISNAGNVDRVTQYFYKNGRYDVHGRGFLGFSEVDSTDVTDQTFNITGVPHIQTASTYNQTFPYVGTLANQTNTDLDIGLLVNSTSSTYSYDKPAQFSTYFVFPKQATSKTYEISQGVSSIVSSAQTTNSYDQDNGDYYGNLTASTVTTYTGDIGATPSYTTNTSNTFDEDTTHWYLGRLTQVQVTRSTSIAGVPAITRTSQFSYFPSSGLLQSETIEPNDSTTHLYLKKQYARDGFGNITKTTISGNDIATRYTTSTFSATAPYFGRFATQTCNAKAQCHQVTYDVSNGNALTDQDPNGLVTTLLYDSNGRPAGSSINQGGLNISSTSTRYLCSKKPALCNSVANGVFANLTVNSVGTQGVVVYDANERAIRTASLSPDGQNWIEALTEYDAAGRPYMASSPHFSTASANDIFWTITQYDDLNRPITVAAPTDQDHAANIAAGTGSITYYDYNGLTTTITNPRTYKTKRVLSATGKLLTVTDPGQDTTTYSYDSFDNLLSVTDSGSHATYVGYDIRGRKLSVSDPNAGNWTYQFDALGELAQQTDAKSQTISFKYDSIGRLIEQDDAQYTTKWVFDTLWVGALTNEQKFSAGGATAIYVRAYTYSTFGAVSTDAQTIDGTKYVTGYQYDSSGRVNQTNYLNGFSTATHYNSFGAVDEIYQPGNLSAAYWKATSWDEFGQIYQETLGNGVQTASNRDMAVGRINAIISGAGSSSTVENLSYSWDANGNITSRTDTNLGSLSETLKYDNRDRLLSSTPSANSYSISTTSQSYDDFGNITTKSGIGTYSYTGSGPQWLTTAGATTFQYDNNGNIKTVNTSGRTYTWLADNMLSSASTTGATVTFEYGAAKDKVSESITQGGSTTSIVFAGSGLSEAWSSSGSVTYRHYITAPTGLIAVVTQGSSQADSVAYLHKDGLGSVNAISDSSGSLLQRIYYDSFGNRKTVFNASGVSGFLSTWGFTGHLEVDNLNLVHMNGRVYDPTIGRFLSPDPNIQDPQNQQSLNRYSYVWNNPLTYTDPSGYFLSGFFKQIQKGINWFEQNTNDAMPVVMAVIFVGVGSLGGPVGAAYGGFMAGLLLSNGNLRAAVIGAAESYAFYETGQAFGGKPPPGSSIGTQAAWYGGKIAAHGLIGGLASRAEHSSFEKGFYSAALPQAVTLATGNFAFLGKGQDLGTNIEKMLAAAVVGGTSSAVGGGKFENGAATAAFAEAFNDLAHPVHEPVSATVDANHDVIITYSDGTQEIRSGGSVSWRNNNPGNMYPVDSSIGTNGHFAIFGSEQDGFNAMLDNLQTPRYQALTVGGAIAQWAPVGDHNDPAHYAAVISAWTGLQVNTQMSTLTAAQLSSVASAIQRFEGWRAGTITTVPAAH